MGFYGNITNTARTQFQFDKIYPNRYVMDRNVHTDGIYIGKYVLVEYDQEYSIENDFTQVYINSDTGIFEWYIEGAEELSAITVSQLGTFEFDGQIITPIVYVEKDEKITFYKVTSSREFDNPNIKYPTFETISITSKDNTYYDKNSIIDKLTYNTSRGYDSTVWMKSYIDGKEKYIMIAELNTVVPTFDVISEAPSMAPIAPHFDTRATNVYYPLHWQTNWGVRIAAAGDKRPDNWDTDDEKSYFSDEKVYYKAERYDSSTNSIISENLTYPGAIYYNKAGFNAEERAVSNEEDKISLMPTGKSGNEYIYHNGDNYKEGPQPDILELAVMLPSLGNAVAQMWDKVYGEDRKLNTAYYYSSNQNFNNRNDNKTFNLNTLAGCINTYHKILGEIIYEVENEEAVSRNDEEYSKHYIYKINNVYKYIHKEYSYEAETGATLGIKDKNPKYALVEIPGLGEDITSIYRLILDIKQILGTENTLDRDTVQGCINTINKIINLYENVYSDNSLIIFKDKFKSASLEGDNWIVGKVEENRVSFNHSTSLKEGGAAKIEGKEDASFIFPVITYDKAGHITKVETETINKLGITISENDTNSTSKIITGVKLSDDYNQLEFTAEEEIGNLILVGYSGFNITNEDSIYIAFQKLEQESSDLKEAIETEVDNRDTAIKALDSYWDRIDTLENTVEQLTKDLKAANDTITALQKSLNDLSTIVEQLSAKIDEYHPTEEDNTIEE